MSDADSETEGPPERRTVEESRREEAGRGEVTEKSGQDSYWCWVGGGLCSATIQMIRGEQRGKDEWGECNSHLGPGAEIYQLLRSATVSTVITAMQRLIKIKAGSFWIRRRLHKTNTHNAASLHI